MSAATKHPDNSQLALFAGGDLGLLERMRVNRHVRSCALCRSSIAGYRAAREKLRQQCQDLPAGLEWDRLASEMTGNIRVGLAAGECIASISPRTKHFGWKPALAVLGLTAIVTSGWWLNFSVEQRDVMAQGVSRIWHREARIPVPDNSVYLEVNRAGIQLRENGSSLTFLHPDAAPAVVSVNTQGSMRARYIDSDTGQVTITNVYAQ